MTQTFKRKNGTVKRVQVIGAHRSLVSSLGSQVKMGDPIVHFSSSRSTGETFVLTIDELGQIISSKIGQWSSRKQWLASLRNGGAK